jgi:hypothetical protein
LTPFQLLYDAITIKAPALIAAGIRPMHGANCPRTPPYRPDRARLRAAIAEKCLTDDSV